MQKLADGTIISQTTSNGFGETVVQALPNTQGGFICTRSEYNAKGQLVKQYRDTGAGTDAMAATLYEYNAMGHLTRETLALAEDATVENSPSPNGSMVRKARRRGYSASPPPRAIMQPVRR